MATRNRRTQNVSCKPNWLLTKLFYCHRSSVFNLIRFIDLCPHPLRQILSCHVVVLRAKDAPGSAEHTFTTRWSRRYPEVLSCHSGEIWQERFVPWPPLQNISLYVGMHPATQSTAPLLIWLVPPVPLLRLVWARRRWWLPDPWMLWKSRGLSNWSRFGAGSRVCWAAGCGIAGAGDQ